MRANFLRHITIRTPNLLIRSQSIERRMLGRTPETPKVSTTQGPKAVTRSHNNSHNEIPDIYSDWKILTVGMWIF